MKYIKKQEKSQPSDRLNQILDKINVSGKKSLTKLEVEFLESYSTWSENTVNDKISEIETEELFLSDDGLFSFKYESREFVDDVFYYSGVLTTPDKKVKKKVVSGVFFGRIIVYPDKNFALDFYNEHYDVFDLSAGYEYELDCFIDDVVTKLQEIH